MKIQFNYVEISEEELRDLRYHDNTMYEQIVKKIKDLLNNK